jgi:hypothetical protein
VAWAGSVDAMNAFIERHALSFPSVNDQVGDVFASFGVSGQPAWVFLDDAGQATRVLGSLSADQLDEAIAAIA